MNDKIIISKKDIQDGFLVNFSKVHQNALVTYLALASFSEDNKNASVTMKELAKVTGLSYPTIHKVITKLGEEDIIKIERQGKQGNSYRI